MKRSSIALWSLGFVLYLIMSGHSGAQDLKEMIQQKVAALKQTVVMNQQELKQFSWIEKTELSVKGDVKNTKLESCRYGTDGKVEKNPFDRTPAKSISAGSGKIAEKKTAKCRTTWNAR